MRFLVALALSLITSVVHADNGADRVAARLVCKGTCLQQHPAKVVRAVGRSMIRTGKAVKLLAGSETLSKTSLEVDFVLSASAPGLEHVGEAYLSAGVWTGSAEYWEQVRNGRAREQHTNMGLGASTLVAGIGWSKTYGVSKSWNGIPALSATTYDKGFGLDVAIPNLALVGIGEMAATTDAHYARGPYMSVGLSVPLPTLLGAPIYASGGVTLFYPPFALLTKHMRVPAAKLERLSNRIETAIRSIGRRSAPKAVEGVIVDDADRLHPRVDDRRADEREAAPLKVLGDARRQLGLRRDAPGAEQHLAVGE